MLKLKAVGNKPKSWFEAYRPVNEPHTGKGLKRFDYNGEISRMYEAFDGYHIQHIDLGFSLRSKQDVEDAILQLRVLERGFLT